MLKYAMFFACLIIWVSGCQFTHPSSKPITSTIAGKYHGQWRCTKSNHSGPIICNLQKQPDNTYKARFSGLYAYVIPFWYNVDFDFKQNKINTDQWQAKGNCDLGWLGGGKYTFDCGIQNETFSVSYDSKVSTGTFDMTLENIK